MKIFKYELEVVDEQTINTHASFLILDVQLQYNKVVLWALVDESSPEIERKFAIYSTGAEVHTVDVYVGSVQTHDPKAVWHVFEIFDNDYIELELDDADIRSQWTEINATDEEQPTEAQLNEQVNQLLLDLDTLLTVNMNPMEVRLLESSIKAAFNFQRYIDQNTE